MGAAWLDQQTRIPGSTSDRLTPTALPSSDQGKSHSSLSESAKALLDFLLAIQPKQVQNEDTAREGLIREKASVTAEIDERPFELLGSDRRPARMTPFTWKTGAQKRTKRIQHYGKSFAYATAERPIGITMTDTGKSVQADGRSRPPGIPSKRQQGLGDNTDTTVEQLSPGDPTPSYSKTQSSGEKLTSTPQADTLKSVDMYRLINLRALMGLVRGAVWI